MENTSFRLQEVHEGRRRYRTYRMDAERTERIRSRRLNKTAKELYGIDNFTDMIGDETVATDPETLVEFLTEKGHPALSMDPMM